MKLTPDVPDALDENGVKDRVALIKMSQRLATAFWAWAIVVGALGGLSVIYLRALLDQMSSITHDMQRQDTQLTLVDERQQNVLRRLDKLEQERRR